jgi:hypothetical protein
MRMFAMQFLLTKQQFPLMAETSYTTDVGGCLPRQFDEPRCRF